MRYLRPSVLGGGDIGLAVKRDIAESVSLSFLQDSNKTLENAKRDVGGDVSRICFLLSCNTACLSKSDGRLLGDDHMDCVLEEFGDPIHRKRDEDKQTDDLGARTATSAGRTGWICTWFIFDIHCNEGDREPGTEGSCENTANKRDEIDMSKLLRNVDAGRSSVSRKLKYFLHVTKTYLVCSMTTLKGILGIQEMKQTTHVNGGCETSNDYATSISVVNVDITKYHSHGKTKDEEDDGVGIEAEVIVAVVDTTTIESLGGSYTPIISAVFKEVFGSSSTVQDSQTATYPAKTARKRRPAHQSFHFGLSILKACSKVGLLSLRIALAIVVRFLVVLLLILAILVVGLLGLHRIVLLVIAIWHLVVAVCFTTSHGDSRFCDNESTRRPRPQHSGRDRRSKERLTTADYSFGMQ
ncbi:DUF580-domain-containing protein, partial [Aureobasidium melanogenum]